MKFLQKFLFPGIILLVIGGAVALGNDFYNHGGFPATGSPATSSSMRAEFDAIDAGFDKLPTITGNANRPIVVNAGATALTTTTGTLSLAGNFTISGAFATTLTVTNTTNVTLPVTGTLATLAGAESWSNKTLVAPILSGSITGTYTLAGTPTITSPAISSPVLSGTATGTYTLAGTPTITGPAISAPVLSGTTTGTYTLAGTPTISAPAISAPVFSGTATGTYTLGGTPTITSPLINTGTVGADPTAALGIASKQYVDAATSKPQDFRLSLTTGVPVTTSDVTGAGTLYAVPFTGDSIALYTGSAWVVRTSSQFSLALTLTAAKPYDVFCYDNAGVPTLEVLVWTNDTTRATALVYQNGVLVKSGATTRRYLGSLYSSGANTTEDSFVKRYLWNYYNRVVKQGRNKFSTDRTTTSTTFVEINSEIRVGFMVGVAEDAVHAVASGGSNSGNYTFNAIAYDGATPEVGSEGMGSAFSAALATGTKFGLAAGFHYATFAGAATASTSTWHATTNTATPVIAAYLQLLLRL